MASNSMSRPFTRFECCFLILFLTSIILVCWQSLGMNTEVSVSAKDVLEARILNDDVNGGHSQGEVVLKNSKVTLNCDTVRSSTFAFCSVLIPFSTESSQRLDLSAFDSMSISINYSEKSGQHDTVLVYLLNDESITSQQPVQKRTRANLAVINPTHQQTLVYTLPLSQFSVPSWWAYAHPEIKDYSSKIDNVKYIQISTGDSHDLKNISLEFSDITFHGKLISTTLLYKSILLAWIVAGSIFVIYRYKSLSQQVVAKTLRLTQMKKNVEALKQQKKVYARLSQQDPLTKVLNRNGFELLFENNSELEQPMSLIVFDVDDFKAINDQFGHSEGDLVLINIVNTVNKVLRREDALARWGGEEFVIMCFNSDILKAKVTAERVRSEIEYQVSNIDGSTVTCTFGVAQYDESLSATFVNADLALYKGKRTGKNRVVCQHD